VAATGLVAVLAACDPPPPPVVLTVDGTGSAADAEPGDGACETSGGDCTLQAAVDEAGATRVDRIVIPAGWEVPGTSVYAVDGLASTLTITSSVAGQPATVRGGFDVTSGGLVLADLVLAEAPQRAVRVGSTASLVLHRTTIRGRGDVGIRVETSDEPTKVLLVDSTIEGGTADAIEVDGIDAKVVLLRSAIADNAGAAVDLDDYYGGTVDVLDSEVRANGSGISGRDAFVTVRRSWIADNGGIALGTGYGKVVVEDSTVSGSARAVSIFWGDAEISRSTLVGNDLGVLSDTSVAVVTASTLVNDVELNTRYDGFVDVDGSILGGPVCTDTPSDGEITSFGWNVAADTSCGLTATGDQQGVDPLLGALGDNGGPTPTVLPAAGSPARDAIAPGTAGLCTVGLTDQRGVTRPQGPSCDVGAVEQ
jgi:hypothetical protein